jgi:hypothetical protein
MKHYTVSHYVGGLLSLFANILQAYDSWKTTTLGLFVRASMLEHSLLCPLMICLLHCQSEASPCLCTYSSGMLSNVEL